MSLYLNYKTSSQCCLGYIKKIHRNLALEDLSEAKKKPCKFDLKQSKFVVLLDSIAILILRDRINKKAQISRQEYS